jgi:apolipoprotein D and lipocalin family protein
MPSATSMSAAPSWPGERAPSAFSLLSTILLALPLAAAPLTTVEQVDLQRYAGLWYEIARLPNRFQNQCAGEVTAHYALREDGRLEVVNRCRKADGKMVEARGLARVVDQRTRARLQVSFVRLFGFQLFWGAYWIIGLGDEYEYALVGHPRRRYGWILSRTPSLPPEQLDRLFALLRDRGYDPEQFVMTRQQPTAP